ncbi:MAG: 3-deoxy-D-manno-octulosonic acid transferase [Cellvibrionaceae bacterium]
MLKAAKIIFLYSFYNVVWLILSLPFLGFLYFRYRAYSQHRLRFLERLSIYKKPIKPTSIWVHVASVGEVIGCLPLLLELKKKYDSHQLVVTTTTPSGENVLRQHLGNDIRHYYLPFDISFLMKRFIKRLDPDHLIIFETEIWPSMINVCANKQIDILLVNARLSDKSQERYAKWRLLSEWIFKKISFFSAQSKNDAENLITLGAKNVAVTGNIKTSIVVSEALAIKAKKIRSNYIGEKNPERIVLLAASTHHKEEELILDAFAIIKQSFPETLLLLIPRHAERFAFVERICLEHKYTVSLRSQAGKVDINTDIVLGDTMGELFTLCGVSDIAIMGGSFIEHGGHNFLEPAAWGVPIISGKSNYNFSETAKGLKDLKALQEVETAEELSAGILALISDKSTRKEKGLAAKQYVESHQGALEKLLAAISPFINR